MEKTTDPGEPTARGAGRRRRWRAVTVGLALVVALLVLEGGLRIYHGNWTVELYGYNLTEEVVQWWGGAAEQVAKGSFSVPRNYGFHVGLKF